MSLENLHILKEKNIVEQMKTKTTPYLQQHLRELTNHPLINKIRNLNILNTIELIQDKTTHKRYPNNQTINMIYHNHYFNNNLIMRTINNTMIITPPLIINRTEINELVEKARKYLNLTLHDL